MRSDPRNKPVWHAAPAAGSDDVIVAFTGWGAGEGKFSFFGLLDLFPHTSKLLIRDPSDSWYNAGLPEFGDTVDEIADRIKGKIAELGARRTIAVGSSMGGYGAILFGCKIGAERVVALVPQTLLHPELPIGPPPEVALQVPDLVPVVQEAPATAIDLVIGWDDVSDVFHAQRIAVSPAVRVLGRAGGHSFAAELYEKAGYWSFIAELIEGRAAEVCEVKPPLEPEDLERIEAAVFAARRSEWEAVEEQIGPLARRNPSWAGPNFLLGLALARLRNWSGAEAALTEAMLANPRWRKIRQELVGVMNERGRADRAEEVIRDGLSLDPRWWQGYLELGDCLLLQGRREDAHRAARHAEQVLRARVADDPRSARAQLALSRALEQLGREDEARAAANRAAQLDSRLAAVVAGTPGGQR